MGTNYEHLTAEERATLMVMRAERWRTMQRAASPSATRSPSYPTMHHWPASGLWCCARSHDEAQSSSNSKSRSPPGLFDFLGLEQFRRDGEGGQGVEERRR